MQPVCVCVGPPTLPSSRSGPSYLYRLHLSGKVGGSGYGPQDEGAPLMGARLPWLRVQRRGWQRIKALFVSGVFWLLGVLQSAPPPPGLCFLAPACTQCGLCARRSDSLLANNRHRRPRQLSDPPPVSLVVCVLQGCSVWKMSGKRDWTPWMKKRRAPVLCALGAVLLCCLQSGASLTGKPSLKGPVCKIWADFYIGKSLIGRL